MEVPTKKKYSLLKKIGLLALVLFMVGIIWVWYVLTEKYSDTSKIVPAYTVTALDLIHEFERNDSLANKKYVEKMMVVNGEVSEVEGVDSTVNIKMADSTSGSYVIFAFQPQDKGLAEKIKVGEKVSIKGSCSGGAFSKILETEFVTFKRCAINH
jgi:hypothetical protein